ncbi:hypothetical protein PUT78_10750 [Roseinatronobacter sp. HJB301]|uniref:MBL fold metallo-hydrolase n=2 Tax=Roseinatronobacter alkalisoli TaxID=3028235 RepID=A0ABT5TCE0_9RHOB|nr:hypothetical protein [Roseinatronobacter sp. HJB301]
MAPPRSGVKIRMYRHGHGDCFLLAFAGRDGRKSRPVYVLIDCGLKNGSEVDAGINDIIDDIFRACSGHIDIVIVTHEHQDHVNGFSRRSAGKRLFDRLTVGQVWLAWTEDGDDPLANDLRARFNDTLITLAFAEARLRAHPGLAAQASRMAELVETETGDDCAALRNAFTQAKAAHPHARAAALAEMAVAGITNKRAIAWLREKAKNDVVFLSPENPPVALPFVARSEVFTLGPPRDPALLLDLDPQGAEMFDLHRGGFGLDGAGQGLSIALMPASGPDQTIAPFATRHCIAPGSVFAANPDRKTPEGYYRDVYDNADESWRRIDDEWLHPTDTMALRLNNEVNNTSLVLAFRLPGTGKTLLFTGDAQRGSWIGWSDLAWTTDSGQVTARDLLRDCVLYKVGHHGSHNATLNGRPDDAHANLGWMAQGDAAREFVAMIPANTAWAMGKARPWAHPMPQIEAALHRKAEGRVLRSDLTPPTSAPPETRKDQWQHFQRRLRTDRLYFELTINDS